VFLGLINIFIYFFKSEPRVVGIKSFSF